MKIIRLFKMIKKMGVEGVLNLSKDSLTGLETRHSLDAIVSKEIKRSARFRRPFCLVFLDLDGLKKINDSLGHLKGDAQLKEVGKVLLKELRTFDTSFRWGGDEFIVTLPETSLVEGEETMRRIERILLEDKIFVSWGVSQFKIGDTLESLIEEAEEKMYKQKKAK